MAETKMSEVQRLRGESFFVGQTPAWTSKWKIYVIAAALRANGKKVFAQYRWKARSVSAATVMEIAETLADRVLLGLLEEPGEYFGGNLVVKSLNGPTPVRPSPEQPAV